MTDTRNKITSAQLACIVFILAMSLKMLVFPILVIKSSGRDATVSVAVLLAAELCCLGAMLAAVALSPDTDFATLLRRTIGKWGARVAYVVLVVYFSLKILLLGGEMRVFFSETLFREFHWQLYSLPLFALFLLFGVGPLRSCGRAAQFLLPFIAAAVVLLFVSVAPGVDYGGALPLLEHGADGIGRDVLHYAMWFGDFSSLIVVLGSVRRTRGTVGWCMLSGVLSTLSVLFFAVILTASFGTIPCYVRYGQNVTGMSQLFLGNSLRGRFDLLVFCMWMMSVLIKAGIFSMALVRCLAALVGGHHGVCGIAVMAVLYILSVSFRSATVVQAFMMRYASPFALICQFGVPILALFAVLRARRHDAKQKDAAPKEIEDDEK